MNYFKNTISHFGLVSKGMHWLMALLIIGLLAVGLYMTNLPAGEQKSTLYGWHKSFGIIILVLALLRVIWSLSNKTPSLNIVRYEQIAARCMHFILYILMIFMPLSGWIMSCAAGHPPSLFGMVTLPNIVAPNNELRDVFALMHQWIAYCLIVLIVIHVLAALKHHFIDKNDILRRML